MPICDRFAVAVVPFPFVDSASAKRRPALALSTAAFMVGCGHGVFAMITTAARSSWPTDVPLRDLAAAGLAHASVVRWKLFTLPQGMVARLAGRLGPADEEAVGRGLRAALGLQAGR